MASGKNAATRSVLKAGPWPFSVKLHADEWQHIIDRFETADPGGTPFTDVIKLIKQQVAHEQKEYNEDPNDRCCCCAKDLNVKKKRQVNDWLDVYDDKCTTCGRMCCWRCLRMCLRCLSHYKESPLVCAACNVVSGGLVYTPSCKDHEWTNCAAHTRPGCGVCRSNYNYAGRMDGIVLSDDTPADHFLRIDSSD